MEAKRGTRQGTRSLSENANTKRATGTKLTEGNGTILPVWETTEVEGEDRDSEYEPDTNQGRARTPGAPIAKRVRNHPNTPIQGYLRSTEKLGAPKEALKEDQPVNGAKLSNAILALLDELKATKAQQEAKDKLVTDGVAALRSEIAALQADNMILKKELREVSKELKALITSNNTRTYAGVAAGTGEGPEPVDPNQDRTPQFSTIQTNPGRLQYQERTIVITLGKSAAEAGGKSTETLKEIA